MMNLLSSLTMSRSWKFNFPGSLQVISWATVGVIGSHSRIAFQRAMCQSRDSMRSASSADFSIGVSLRVRMFDQTRACFGFMS